MKVRSNKIGDIRSYYRRQLSGYYDDRESDTLLFTLLNEYTGLTKAEILTNLCQPVNESSLLKIHLAVKELIKGKPIQYILGFTEFYGLKINVNSKVLIPRPETEELVERVLNETDKSKNPMILDVGTGSGCIAIALKKHIPSAALIAVDVSTFALEVAVENATLHQMDIDFRKIDILDKTNWEDLGKVDVIVSNPPYVRDSEKAGMKKNVLEYEPHIALFVPDKDPLLYYKTLAQLSLEKLNPGGGLFCEVNQYMGSEILNFFTGKGFMDVRVHWDISGNMRILQCIR